jgi:hypothetical protein
MATERVPQRVWHVSGWAMTTAAARNPTKPARDSAASSPPSSVATPALALIKILQS